MATGGGKPGTVNDQGSAVVCAQLVRTRHSGWKGSDTVAVNRRQGRLCWSYDGSDQECAGRGSIGGTGGGSGGSSGGGRGFATGGRYEVAKWPSPSPV